MNKITTLQVLIVRLLQMQQHKTDISSIKKSRDVYKRQGYSLTDGSALYWEMGSRLWQIENGSLTEIENPLRERCV